MIMMHVIGLIVLSVAVAWMLVDEKKLREEIEEKHRNDRNN